MALMKGRAGKKRESGATPGRAGSQVAGRSSKKRVQDLLVQAVHIGFQIDDIMSAKLSLPSASLSIWSISHRLLSP